MDQLQCKTIMFMVQLQAACTVASVGASRVHGVDLSRHELTSQCLPDQLQHVPCQHCGVAIHLHAQATLLMQEQRTVQSDGRAPPGACCIDWNAPRCGI